MKWLIICILIIGIIVRFTTTIGDREVGRLKLAGLQQELSDVWNEGQCYHEELIRIVLEHHPDSIYTIPCNGRKVVVR